MLNHFFKRCFGSRGERVLKRIRPLVEIVNAYEPELSRLSDLALKDKTAEFKTRFASGASLEDLLPEAFAVVREAATRTLSLRHFDVQLIGGIVLHQGKIAEMRTGEGKTLMSTLPAYLNALSGRGVHIVTVNDYLAQRDRDWMAPIYEALGVSVGVNVSQMTPEEKRSAYAADIVYGTNNEFGFDYLRDNMAFSLSEKVQRGLVYAIVDEVDSIFIDEARTPLIISGISEDSSALYTQFNEWVPELVRQQGPELSDQTTGDFFIDEKQRQVFLTEQGYRRIEALLARKGLLQPDQSLYQPAHIGFLHHVKAALRAHMLYFRDVHYIVRQQEVVIVDEHTGRTMAGRRWSDGLHQAIEAKEGVRIQPESQTLASTTFQNYFRLYEKLAGMTGTADTEAYEFQDIYQLEVLVIPTHRPMIRMDQPDQVYLSQQGKFNAITEDIRACRLREQPVLVGTASIETSERLASLLEKQGIPHQVLNAKFHDKEAKIVAEAGRPGMVTIATNMAGRGTDIVLGGNLEAELKALPASASPEAQEALQSQWSLRHTKVIEAGGLRVIGSERHESRRIDNQLRGRSGRQGDPGSSQFYLSLEDNLMRIFASDRMSAMMRRLWAEEDKPIEHPWINKGIANAQRKVESYHFDIRKQLLSYDNIASQQRHAIYQWRDAMMGAEDIRQDILDMRKHVIHDLLQAYLPPEVLEEHWDRQGLMHRLKQDFALDLPIQDWLAQETSSLDSGLDSGLEARLLHAMEAAVLEQEAALGLQAVQHLEKSIFLQTLDTQWRDHLLAMDDLRQGIHLRGYAQKDPKQEYKVEAYRLFTQLLDTVRFQVIRSISLAQVQAEEDLANLETRLRQRRPKHLDYVHAAFADPEFEADQPIQAGTPEEHSGHQEGKSVTTVRKWPKLSRNALCHCGSGKKFKHCHGQFS